MPHPTASPLTGMVATATVTVVGMAAMVATDVMHTIATTLATTLAPALAAEEAAAAVLAGNPMFVNVIHIVKFNIKMCTIQKNNLTSFTTRFATRVGFATRIGVAIETATIAAG